MFDVTDDKPEVYTLSHQPWAGLGVINPRAILHEGFIKI